MYKMRTKQSTNQLYQVFPVFILANVTVTLAVIRSQLAMFMRSRFNNTFRHFLASRRFSNQFSSNLYGNLDVGTAIKVHLCLLANGASCSKVVSSSLFQLKCDLSLQCNGVTSDNPFKGDI